MNSFKYLFFGFLILLLGCSSEQDEKGELWVFIMAGQSNMAGRAKIEAQDKKTDERILCLGKNNQWVTAEEPLHYYTPKISGLDCGMSFAKAVLKVKGRENIRIGLVPCAVSGASVEEWLKDQTRQNVKLFSNLESKLAIAKKEGTIKGILWHQGEANAKPKRIGKYEPRLTKMFAKLRAACGDKKVPIFAGEVGSFAKPASKKKLFSQVNQSIQKVAAKDPHTYLIKSNGLKHNGDNLHFNAPSIRELGVRYAKSFNALQKSKK